VCALPKRAGQVRRKRTAKDRIIEFKRLPLEVGLFS